MSRLLTACALLLFAGAALAVKPQKELQPTLLNYAATLRWGDFEQGLAFIDPDVLKQHPLTRLELDRYRQVRVSYYHDQGVQNLSPTEIAQVVEIGVVNEHTQTERAVVDRQRWRWDKQAKRWWLMTGLPDITHED